LDPKISAHEEFRSLDFDRGRIAAAIRQRSLPKENRRIVGQDAVPAFGSSIKPDWRLNAREENRECPTEGAAPAWRDQIELDIAKGVMGTEIARK
jgi:hypothetical protein